MGRDRRFYLNAAVSLEGRDTVTEPVIYRRIPPCDAGALASAAPIGVADLHEGLGAVAGRMALMAPEMKAIGPGIRCIGQAVTAYNYPGDNLMIHKALEVAGAGHVLVLCNGGGSQGALWGEMATLYARKKGIAGVVADGPVRDVDAIREMGFPVFATVISPCHAEKRGPGSVNVPVVCAGVLVEPGDVIAADGDGVLVIPRALLSEVVADASARSGKETEFRTGIESGRSLHEMTGIDQSFAKSGIRERDEVWPGGRS